MAERGVRFLFYAHLPPGLVDALEALGEPAEHVAKNLCARHPGRDVDSPRGRARLVHHHAGRELTRKPHEAAALREAGVGAFFLLPGKRSPRLCQIIQTVIRHWPEIKRLARSERRPFVFQVTERQVRRLR